MQGDNGAVKVASNISTPSSNAVLTNPAEQKLDLARQFTAATNSPDGGLIAQLTSNPFFTAVCTPLCFVSGPRTRSNTL